MPGTLRSCRWPAASCPALAALGLFLFVFLAPAFSLRDQFHAGAEPACAGPRSPPPLRGHVLSPAPLALGPVRRLGSGLRAALRPAPQVLLPGPPQGQGEPADAPHGGARGRARGRAGGALPADPPPRRTLPRDPPPSRGAQPAGGRDASSGASAQHSRRAPGPPPSTAGGRRGGSRRAAGRTEPERRGAGRGGSRSVWGAGPRDPEAPAAPRWRRRGQRATPRGGGSGGPGGHGGPGRPAERSRRPPSARPAELRGRQIQIKQCLPT